MAGFIPAPNIVSVTMLLTVDNQRVENVLHYKFAVTVNNAQLQAIVNFIDTQFWPLYKATLCNQISLIEIKAIDLTVQNGAEYKKSYAVGAEPGLIVGPVVPGNVALVVTHNTASRGKSYRGRTYIPGVCMYRLSSGVTVLVSQITETLTAFNKLLTAVAGIGATLVVLSKYANKLQRPTAIGTPIVSFTANNALDSQRRRLLGRGT